MSIVGYGILARLGTINLVAYRRAYPTLDIHYNSSSDTVLITAKDKWLKIVSYPNQALISAPSPNQEEIITIQQAAGIDQPLQLYLLPIHPSSNLKIITFNLARQVQANQVSGSERLLVEKCQQAYPLYEGWSEPPQTSQVVLSQCTLNSALWLADHKPGLIALQESVSRYLPLIVEIINQRTGHCYRTIGSNEVQLIYNPDILGLGELLSPSDLYIIQPDRGMIVVWFPQIKILAINLHAPHNVDLAMAIMASFNRVPISVNPDRIIMTGDFNDGYKSPLTQLTIMGKVLRQHDSPAQSCCNDTGYNLIGDYIFDSESSGGFYGIPPDAHQKLMSDHHPVVYEPDN